MTFKLKIKDHRKLFWDFSNTIYLSIDKNLWIKTAPMESIIFNDLILIKELINLKLMDYDDEK